jgi:hypothetical protein
MNKKVLFASLSRISDLPERDFACEPLPREAWELGDYVVAEAEVIRGGFANVELATGRIAKASTGDLILGALGERHATLEVVGSWEAIGDDGVMHMMTAAGLVGRATSISGMLPHLIQLAYRGHATREGTKLNMRDFARAPVKRAAHGCPTIMIIGTSMSAGKTTSAGVLIRHLVAAGLRVTGAKLTGAGRYRDVLAMEDAGAERIFDFVDVGLPSSIGDPTRYRADLRALLGLVAEGEPDVLVAEVGASPLEPYNGEVALEELGDTVQLTVLCASDPYAVVGVMRGFGIEADLIAGLATSTVAGVEVVEKLSGVTALNLLDPASVPALRKLLASKLGARWT